VMTKTEKRVPWVSAVTLHPRITYSGGHLPEPADEQRLHHAAHEQCFIANSVKTNVSVQPATS
jgi:organic hydroperoxide reductase OsmC/OhrA